MATPTPQPAPPRIIRKATADDGRAVYQRGQYIDDLIMGLLL